MWARRSLWIHCSMSAYLWLIAWLPLGNWNRHADENILPQILEGKGLHVDDIAALAFVTAPALLFWLAYRYRKFWLGVAALALDAFWAFMQIQSWWIPYLFGSRHEWQIRYAHGPTTKTLPSFGNDVAPDGMHLVIHMFLVIAIITGVLGLLGLHRRITGRDENHEQKA